MPLIEADETDQTQLSKDGSTVLTSLWSCIRGKSLQALPTHRTDQLDKTLTVEGCQSSRTQPVQAYRSNHKFVLLCIPYMRWGTKAHQPDVCAIESDQQFFNLLRASYDTYRTQSRWHWLRSVRSIRLAKV